MKLDIDYHCQPGEYSVGLFVIIPRFFAVVPCSKGGFQMRIVAINYFHTEPTPNLNRKSKPE